MFQDTRFQFLLSGDTSGGSAYIAVPYRCTVLDVDATLQGSTGSTSAFDITVTELTSSGSIGVAAFSNSSSSLAAAATTTYSEDSSSGNAVLAAGTVLKFDVASGDVSGSFAALVNLELDPNARTL